MDTKKLARFQRPGHRVTGDISQFSRKPGYHALHVAIDDHSRVGFSLILPDEKAKSALTFTLAALRYCRALGEGGAHHDRQWVGIPVEDICQAVAAPEKG